MRGEDWNTTTEKWWRALRWWRAPPQFDRTTCDDISARRGGKPCRATQARSGRRLRATRAWARRDRARGRSASPPEDGDAAVHGPPFAGSSARMQGWANMGYLRRASDRESLRAAGAPEVGSRRPSPGGRGSSPRNGDDLPACERGQLVQLNRSSINRTSWPRSQRRTSPRALDLPHSAAPHVGASSTERWDWQSTVKPEGSFGPPPLQPPANRSAAPGRPRRRPLLKPKGIAVATLGRCSFLHAYWK